MRLLIALSVAGIAATVGAAAPDGKPPAGCSSNFDGQFEVTVVQGSASKRDLSLLKNHKRGTCSPEGILVVTLKDGVLKDAQGRTGYISASDQFQFDDPPQENALYTSGFSVCDDGLLALGSSKDFFSCQSGDFSNLYDRNWAPQCAPVHLAIMPCGGGSGGQVVGTAVVDTTVVITLSDGQTQVVATQAPIPICQIGDGQVQQHTTPCEELRPGPQPTGAPIVEPSDGQLHPTGTAAPPPPEETATGIPQATSTAAPINTGGVGGGAPNSTIITIVPSVIASTVAPVPSESGPVTVPASAAAAVGLAEGPVAALAIGVLGAVWLL